MGAPFNVLHQGATDVVAPLRSLHLDSFQSYLHAVRNNPFGNDLGKFQVKGRFPQKNEKRGCGLLYILGYNSFENFSLP